MNESDWKIFEHIKRQAMERYCQETLDECRGIIDDEEQSFQQRYSAVLKLMQRKEENMQLLFEGHSKSAATFQLMAIRGEGLVDEEFLEHLSKAFLSDSDPTNYSE